MTSGFGEKPQTSLAPHALFYQPLYSYQYAEISFHSPPFRRGASHRQRNSGHPSRHKPHNPNLPIQSLKLSALWPPVSNFFSERLSSTAGQRYFRHGLPMSTTPTSMPALSSNMCHTMYAPVKPGFAPPISRRLADDNW